MGQPNAARVRLFPRRPGGKSPMDSGEYLQARNKAWGHRILDAVKAGEKKSQSVIDWALRQTGDA